MCHGDSRAWVGLTTRTMPARASWVGLTTGLTMGWPYDSDEASTSLVGVVSLRGALGAVGDPREGLWAVLQRHTAWNLPCLQALLKRE